MSAERRPAGGALTDSRLSNLGAQRILEGFEDYVGRFRASFSMPGEYMIRIRIDNFGGDSSPGNQCCWSNGYVRVSVTE